MIGLHVDKTPSPRITRRNVGRHEVVTTKKGYSRHVLRVGGKIRVASTSLADILLWAENLGITVKSKGGPG